MTTPRAPIGGANSGPPRGDADAAHNGERHRLHPLTPIAQAAQVLPVTIAIIIFSGGFSFITRIYIAVVAAVVLGALTAGFSYLQWRRFSFFFDDSGDLRVESGVLQISRRTVALSRLQSVDVNSPFWARLFGLAELTVEVAGSGQSKVALRYLSAQQASELRNELLARAAGVGPTSDAAPEAVIARVTPADLLLSLLIRSQTLILFALSALLLMFAFATGGVGALGIALVTGGVPAFAVVGEFLRSYDFTVARSPDGLRIRRGLTSTVASTVPPGRVHAVGFESGPVWRRLGWVRVLVDLGGNPGGGEEQQTSTVLLPVAAWPVAREVVSHLLPGVDLESFDFEGVPTRARYRAPLQHRRIGVSLTPQVFAARRGWLTHRLTVVPHGRVQSTQVTQGPWQRWLRLSTLHVDTVPGPVRAVVPQIDGERARAVLDAELDLARNARSTDLPPRWMQARWDHRAQGHDERGDTGDDGRVGGL